MKSPLRTFFQQNYISRKENGIIYDEERFRNVYGDFVPVTADLSYLLGSKKFADLVSNIHDLHRDGKGILFSGSDVDKTEDAVQFFQTEVFCWGYCQFRTTLSEILELKYGNARKQEDSTEQKQWERINRSEFLIIDLWDDDFEDKKRLGLIGRLVRERLRRTLATVLVVNFPLENLVRVASEDFYSLLMEEDKFIIFNSMKEKVKR